MTPAVVVLLSRDAQLKLQRRQEDDAANLNPL
jgi:hypothetical protein